MYLFDIALQLSHPTFTTVDQACNFPCSEIPTMCPKQEEAEEIAARKAAELEATLMAAAGVSDSSQCTAPLTDYVGNYSHPLYGPLIIVIADPPTNTVLQGQLGNTAIIGLP